MTGSTPTPITPPTKPRPWGPIIAAAVVVVLVLGAGVVWFSRSHNDHPKAAASASSGSGAASSTPVQQPAPVAGSTAKGVNGCLGGPDPSTAINDAMKAPITPAGAVSFTATLMRWAYLSSRPVSDLDKIGTKVMPSSLVTNFKVAQGRLRSGESLWVDMTKSHYSVRFSGKSALVTMDFIAHAQGGSYGDGQDAALFGTMHLVATKDNRWFLKSVTKSSSRAAIEALPNLPGGC